MLAFLLASLLVTSATAGIACVNAPCQDYDAQLHEATCLSRCDCIWDSEGVPKSKTYPSCLSAPDTAEVHVSSYFGTVETYLADDITGFQLCQGKDDGQAAPLTCEPSTYADENCGADKNANQPPEADWINVEMTSATFGTSFDTHDEPKIAKTYGKPKPYPASAWAVGTGWTKCAAENVRKLQKDTCPYGYCAAEHFNISKVPWACCSKCPGGTKQCFDNCKCRCTKKCTEPMPTPEGGGQCNCGNNVNVRFGNGANWSPSKVKTGLFKCSQDGFDPTEPSAVSTRQGHCECDQTESITESSGTGAGYSQCSNFAIKKSSGTLAVWNGVTSDGKKTMDLENYQFKVDILHDGSIHASVGVVFRYQDKKNYYRVVITSWCTTLIRVKNGLQTKVASKYKSAGGGYPRGSNGKDVDWLTLGVAVESNDITITVDHAVKGNILRMQQEENPIKTIVKGGFGLYSSQGKKSFFKNLRFTPEMCHHVTNIIIPTKNVDNWEVLSFHATRPTGAAVGALMVATTTGFLSNDKFKCTDTDPTKKLGGAAWYKNDFNDDSWAQAKVLTNKLVHPHDIVGAAKWIWTTSKTSTEIWCRGKRGTESLIWNGNQYHVLEGTSSGKSWEAAELQCQSIGSTCHLASIHGVEEAEMINTMAQSMAGHGQTFWIGLNDRSIENSYVNIDGTKADWFNWNKGEPNDVKHNEDCVEFHTYDGHWNDNKCGKQNPSICKCPASGGSPEDPSSSDNTPDDSGQEDGADTNKQRTCAMYLGGLSSGTSWFDTPAQPYSGATCDVFDAKDSCCSSPWVQDNVNDDLFALTDLISPDNTGCMNAVEALRCIVCSPYQSNFMSKMEGGQWNIDVCISTSMAVYDFCLKEAKTLFPTITDADTLTPALMVQQLTTRVFGPDAGVPGPTVNSKSESYDSKKCFLHDILSPKIINVTFNGTDLTVTFNEPLSVVPVGEHAAGDQGDVDSAPAVSNNVNEKQQPLIAIVECKSKSCIKTDGSTGLNSLDGQVIWSALELNDQSENYVTTTYLTDTVIISTKITDHPIIKTGDVADASGKITNMKKDSKFGYAIWLSDNSVFDRADNSYAGSDLDEAMFITLNYKNPILWGLIITAIVCSLLLIGFGVYVCIKKKRNEDVLPACCSTCSGRGGGDKDYGDGFSSGGFAKLSEDA